MAGGRLKWPLTALLIAVLPLVAAGTPHPTPQPEHPQPPAIRPATTAGSPQSRRRASINIAAARAQQLNGGGRVLSVRETTSGYHVKLIKQGEVRIVVVPRN